VNSEPVPRREAILPPAVTPTLNPAQRRVNPNAVTRSEMPAARAPLPTVDDEEEERVTQVSNTAELVHARDRFVLLRLDGVDAGKISSLRKGSSVLGRTTSSDLQLDDGGVSRQHAKITWNGRSHTIEDLKSRNGTFVRGERITRAELADGDLIQLGPHACFRYNVTDELHERLLLQLFESSTRDPLTDAYNRRHFDERLRAELAYAVRHQSSLALVMFDIDHFKKVNDSFGHAAGDAVIKHIARVTSTQLRSEDVFARYGGEEFVMLLRGINSQGVVRVAERLRASIDALAAVFEDKRIPVSVSAGCAVLEECPSRSATELLAVADNRLYAAKNQGRNRVVGPR
jgi:two-component system, cell cycle response regulator